MCWVFLLWVDTPHHQVLIFVVHQQPLHEQFVSRKVQDLAPSLQWSRLAAVVSLNYPKLVGCWRCPKSTPCFKGWFKTCSLARDGKGHRVCVASWQPVAFILLPQSPTLSSASTKAKGALAFALGGLNKNRKTTCPDNNIYSIYQYIHNVQQQKNNMSWQQYIQYIHNVQLISYHIISYRIVSCRIISYHTYHIGKQSRHKNYN